MGQTDRQQDAHGQEPSGRAMDRPGWSVGRVFSFDLPVPPTANTYYRTMAYIPKDELQSKPKAATYISKGGLCYRDEVWFKVRGHSRELTGAMPLTARIAVEVRVHFTDRKRCDIDNRLKPLLDALQHAGVMEDDSQVDDLRITRGGVRPGGRCFVTVAELLPDVQQQELPL